jgi:hypothetical protein
MEIYVMKKKFVLTLALVLMVAVTLTAATPLEVSGKFVAGYNFEFGNNAKATSFDDDSQVTVNAKFAGDFWNLELVAPYKAGKDDSTNVTAKANILLDKALAEQGVDMGDVKLTLHVGTGVGAAAPTVSANVYDSAPWKKKDVGFAKGTNFGLTIGYAELGTVYVSYDPVDGKAFVVGAKLAPVDGVTAALGFTNDLSGKNAFGVSAAADIAALADLDFDLKTTVEYVVALDPAKHHLLADVAGSYEGIGLWVAFQSDFEKYALAAHAGYETEIEGFALSAGATLASKDVSEFGDNFTVALEAGAGYKMGGVSYALDLGYTIDKGNTKPFTLSPSVTISF